MLKMFSIAFVSALLLAAGGSLCQVKPEAKGSTEAEPRPVAEKTPSKKPPKKPRPADTKDLENLKKELLAQIKKLSQRLDTEITGIKLDMDRLGRDVRENYRNLRDLPEESLGLKDEMGEVKRDLRDVQSQIRSLQRENNDLKQDVDDLQREIRYLKRKIR